MVNEMVRTARACLGTPFHHQGRQPGVGLDCAGLLVVICQSVGLEVLDLPAYGRYPHGGELEAAVAAQPFLRKVVAGERAAGDVLLMRFTDAPQHLGLWTGDTLIHAYESVGRVVEHRLDGRWGRRVVGTYRVIGGQA